VKLKGRKIVPDHFDNPKILDDDAVRSEGGQILKELINPIRLTLFKNRVNRDIYFTAHLMEAPEGPLKLGIGKIGAPHPGVKILKPQINPVGALPNRRVQRFGGTRGG
jgi:hypothetical protein